MTIGCRTLAGFGLLLACTFFACATYHPAPLNPKEAERRFEQIRLDDPNLCAYLNANLQRGLTSCPPARWNLAELTLAGWYFNPQVAVAEAKLSVAQAGIITAAQRPNPSAGIGTAYTASSAPSFAPWAIGLAQINFPIETAGRRGYRIAAAERNADAAAFAVGEAAWRVRSAVRAALVAHLAAEREYQLARSYESASARVASLLQERLEAGAAAAPAVNLALANLAAARLRLVRARSRVPETLNALAATLGVPARALDGARFAWPGYENPPQMAGLTPARLRRLALLNRIDLRRMLARYAAADDALKLEIARQYPNINLGGGYSWEVGENLFELLPVVTLPVMNQNQGPIAQARARRLQAAAEFVALQDSVIAQADSALTAYRGARDAFEQAAHSAVYSQRRLTGIERAAELGDVSGFALATARLETIAARQSQARALAAAQQAMGALEDAAQHPLNDSDLKSFQLPTAANIERGHNQ